MSPKYEQEKVRVFW